jgi:hypothetical protein
LSRDPDEVNERHVFLADLPDHLRKQIRGITKRIWGLHQDVVAELEQLQPGREIRSVLQASEDDQERSAGRERRKG